MKKSFFFILVLLVITACSEVSKTQPKQTEKKTEIVPFIPKFNTVSPQLAKEIKDTVRWYFSNYLNIKPFSGMLLVAKNGKIVYERYTGMSNKSNKVPMADTTPIHVASISKVVTACCILRLVDQGKIELDKDIRSYLPLIPYTGITVRMLLNHRSGLPYYAYFDTKMWSSAKNMTNQDILEVLNVHQPALYFPPNSQFSYCNTNFALLALIVEKVYEKPFAKAVKQLVLDPLEMKHSFVYTPKMTFNNLGQSYDSRGRLEEFTNLDEVVGDKNFYTTARDLLQLDKGTYSTSFLSEKMKTEMFRGYSYEKEGKSNYGLGVRMREEKGKEKLIFHTGWWHGNTGCFASLRKDTICMIVLSNQFTRNVFSINRLSTVFGNYPCTPLVNPKENFMSPALAKARTKSSKSK